MSTVADIVERVRIRLQDRDRSNYAWPTDVLEEFVTEGLNRLAPAVFYRSETDVTPGEFDTEFNMLTYVGPNYRELEDVVSDTALPGWYLYGSNLIFEQAPNADFTLRAICDYSDVGDLPVPLVDAVVLYTCSRALLWLLRRGGHGLRRYLADQGDLEPNELDGMANFYREDFNALREDWGRSSYRRF